MERGTVRIARSHLRLVTSVETHLVNGVRELHWRTKQLGSVPRLLERYEQALAEKAKLRDALDPERMLDRGYSVTRDDAGNLITSIQAVGSGQVIRTHVRDGILISTIESVEGKRSDD